MINKGESNEYVRVDFTEYRGFEQIAIGTGKRKQLLNVSFAENDGVPQLVEVRFNNKQVPLAKRYQINESMRLMTLKFAPFYKDSLPYIYQFAFSPNGFFEDFADDDMLTLNLPEGNNTIYVRAVDTLHNVSTKKAKIILDVDYQLNNQNWFWAMMLSLIILPVIYFLYRFKITKQKNKFIQALALERQRNKLSADLHDDVGASLSSLQVNSVVAQKLLTKNPERANDLLEKIAEQSKALSERLGDMIWSMKPGKDEFMHLSSRIKNFATDILGDSEIFYEILIDKKVDEKIEDVTIRKNIIFICKEAINNIAKYSKANKMKLTIRYTENLIQIVVTDNGIGFNTATKKGNGIANMKQRTEELGGVFVCEPAENQGTKISVSIPQ